MPLPIKKELIMLIQIHEFVRICHKLDDLQKKYQDDLCIVPNVDLLKMNGDSLVEGEDGEFCSGLWDGSVRYEEGNGDVVCRGALNSGSLEFIELRYDDDARFISEVLEIRQGSAGSSGRPMEWALRDKSFLETHQHQWRLTFIDVSGSASAMHDFRYICESYGINPEEN